MLDQKLHPEILNKETEQNYLQEELGKIDEKLQELISNHDDLVMQDELIRQKAAEQVPKRKMHLQSQILEYLELEPLSELRIAKEINELPETVFLILSYLETKKLVKYNTKEMKWYGIRTTPNPNKTK